MLLTHAQLEMITSRCNRDYRDVTREVIVNDAQGMITHIITLAGLDNQLDRTAAELRKAYQRINELEQEKQSGQK